MIRIKIRKMEFRNYSVNSKEEILFYHGMNLTG